MIVYVIWCLHVCRSYNIYIVLVYYTFSLENNKIPLWIQVCTGAPQFYSYKAWGYRSPPQGNLYRMGVHRFFFASFSLKNGEAKVQKGQVLFLTFHLYKILGCRFHICAPKPGWNILSWLGAWGGVHSYRSLFLEPFRGDPYSHVWWIFKVMPFQKCSKMLQKICKNYQTLVSL